MKRITILVMCLLASISYVAAQKILVDEFDPFDKVRRVHTSFVKICDNPSGEKILMCLDKQVWIAIENIGGKEYIRLKWCCQSVQIIPKGEIVKFMDANGEIYELENCIYEVSEKGRGVPGLKGSAYLGVNLRLSGEPGILNGKDLKLMRITTTDGYVDIEVDKKAEKKISKLYQVYQKVMDEK